MAINRQLRTKEKKYIDFCEQWYWLRNKGYPSNEVAATALGYTVSDIQYFLNNKQVQKALDRRGLPWHSHSNAELTPLQLAAALSVTNFADTRSTEHKLDELGILPDQYRAWLNHPVFHEFVNRRADENLQNIRPEAVTEFAKLVRKGDLGAIKFYFEVTGQNKSHDIQNLQNVIQFIIEIIQKHVKDPATLAALAQDILNAAPGIANGVQVNVPQLEAQPVRVKDEIAERGNVLSGNDDNY